MPEYIDIHSHINFRDYDSDREEVITRLKENNVWTITVGTELKSSIEAIELSRLHEGLFASIGLHPTDTASEDFDPAQYEKLVVNPKVVAIGECGLDYFRLKGESGDEKARQKKVFEKQIEFALRYDKPLMIHCRNAYEDVLNILSSYKKSDGPKLRGDVHFFAGNVEIAKRFIELGFALSFTGVLTFTSDYDAVVAYAPLESILSETDAPFVAPVPFRGKRNDPLYVREIVKRIAEIKKLDLETVKKAMILNANRLFNLV
jgi:TatD DNase family protein